MARGRFTAYPDMAKWRQLGKPYGYLLLKPSKDDAEGIREMLRVHEHDCAKRVEAGEPPRQITFVWDVAYGKRSLSKNSLTWALLTLTVHLMNEGMPEGQEKLTPVKLYNQDMGKVAPCKAIEVEAAALPWLEEIGVKVKAAVPIEGTAKVTAYVVKTSSKWDEREAHLYIEHLFNRLAMMGIPLPEDQVRLKTWWLDWIDSIEEHRVELHAEEVSKDQYRELHPLCEGCGEFIGLGGGHVHHIKSVGAGGAEPTLDRGANWLHLCPKCHAIWTSVGGGVKAFIEKCPHLKSKIERALAEPALGEVAETVKKSHEESVAMERQGNLFGDAKPKERLADYDDGPDGPNGIF